MRIYGLVVLLLVCAIACIAETPVLSPAILFLGTEPQIDAQYAKELGDAGYGYVTQSIYEPLTYAFMKRFTVVVLDKFPWYGAEYQIFGQRMRFFTANLDLVWRFARDGGGVLVYTNQTDGGGALARQWNTRMRPWDIQLVQACVRDTDHAFGKFRVYGDNYYCWTDAVTPHPATDGVKRCYYPSVNGRFDDNYTTTPFVCGAVWIPLVKAMPTARVIVEVNMREIELPEHKQDTTLVAVRPIGAGRLAACAINPAYTHQLGYTLNGRNSEANYGPVDGMILRKGDGKTPSDTGRLLLNLYRWLGEPALAKGFGGYHTGDPVGKAPVAPNPDVVNFNPHFDPDGEVAMPPSWRHRPEVAEVNGDKFGVQISDPIITGPLRMFKGLIGIHSAASDGKGTVRDFARAAKKAGYRIIVFTEGFADLTPAKYTQLLADCQRETTSEFACVPGYDIQDRTGNHTIVVGADRLPRPQWLSDDGKRLVQTPALNWMLGGISLIAHRPLHGTIPYERLKHFQSLTVFTYRAGTLLEDATAAYDWQGQSSSNPNPVVVHEVFDPREVAAATRGYQQILPSDTVEHAVGYLCAGLWNYFDGPARYILSAGPEVYTFTANNKDAFPERFNRRQWRIFVGVRSDVPLREVCLVDGGTVIRRWHPNTKDFHTTVDLRHTRQYAIYLTARDANGRDALTAGLRTCPPRLIFRCPDRQNWLGDVGFLYTGTFLPPSRTVSDIIMPVKGTSEGSGLFPEVPGANMAVKLDFPFTSNTVVITQARINEKYSTALFNGGSERIGLDGTPSQASEPSTVYDAVVRDYNFTPGNGTTETVALMEYTITLKRDVEPVNPAGLFPALGRVQGTRYWWLQEGKPITGALDPTQPLDIPVGGMAGGIIALTPGLRVQNGLFGLAPAVGQPAVLKKGTTFIARFLIRTGTSTTRKQLNFDTDTEGWMRNLGSGGETPYRLALSRGMLEGISYYAACTSVKGGIAGQVITPATLPFQVPLRVSRVNDNWPCGLWRDDGSLTYLASFEHTTWPLLDTAKVGAFYAGNLLTATDDRLMLEIVKWTKDRLSVELHNPTDAPITATITSPPEITGLKAIARLVTVASGTSQRIDEGTVTVAPGTSATIPEGATVMTQSMPRVTRCEVITAHAATGDGGNAWGGHQSRIVRTADGVFAAYTVPGTDFLHKTWQLVTRTADGRWIRLAEGPAGKDPMHLLAGPDGRLYLIAWPDGRPRLWSGRPVQGVLALTDEPITGPWITNDWPYSSAGISALGDLALVQSVGAVPGSFLWGYRPGDATTWITGTTPVTEKHCYTYVLPQSDGRLSFTSTRDVLASAMGYEKSATTHPLGYVFNRLGCWNTENVAAKPLTELQVAESLPSKTFPEVAACGTCVDTYRDTRGRVHVFYYFVGPETRGKQCIRHAIVENGRLVKTVQLPAAMNVYFTAPGDGKHGRPKYCRLLQDQTGRFYLLGTTAIIPADADDGTTLGKPVRLDLQGYRVEYSGIAIAAPRGGTPPSNVVDAIFPTENGTKVVYIRIEL